MRNIRIYTNLVFNLYHFSVVGGSFILQKHSRNMDVKLTAEGPNGCGKTALLEKLRNILKSEGYKVAGDPKEHSLSISKSS